MLRSPGLRLLDRTAPAALLLALACAGAPAPAPQPAGGDAAVYLRAEAERAQLLGREVARLRTDLAEAELALVAAESGMRGSKTRADAVAAVAGARVQVERAREEAPWQAESLVEADAKCAEADRQIEKGHFATAIFFASRAERVARQALEQARVVAEAPGTRQIAASRVNLRQGPSLEHDVLTVLLRHTPVFPERTEGEWLLVRTADGRAGWVHATLVR